MKIGTNIYPVQSVRVHYNETLVIQQGINSMDCTMRQTPVARNDRLAVITSRISGRGNRIGPVCLCVC